MTRLARSLSVLRRLRLARRDAAAPWSDRLDRVALADADRELDRHDDAIGYDAVTRPGPVLVTGQRYAGHASGRHPGRRDT